MYLFNGEIKNMKYDELINKYKLQYGIKSCNEDITLVQSRFTQEDMAALKNKLNTIDDPDDRIDAVINYIDKILSETNDKKSKSKDKSDKKAKDKNVVVNGVDVDGDGKIDLVDLIFTDIDEEDDDDTLSEDEMNMLSTYFPDEMGELTYEPEATLDTYDATSDDYIPTQYANSYVTGDISAMAVTEVVFKKRVFRKGKRVIVKKSSRPGYKVVDGREVRMSYAELRNRARSAKRAARRPMVAFRRQKTMNKFKNKYKFMTKIQNLRNNYR